jgi:hypothetical protein
VSKALATHYHELGHAVIAELLGAKRIRISAIPNGEQLGAMESHVPAAQVATPDARARYYTRVVLAGPIAEEIFEARDPLKLNPELILIQETFGGGERTYDVIERLSLEYWNGDKLLANQWIEACARGFHRWVTRQLKHNWPLIEQRVDRLRRDGEITINREANE